LISSEPPSPDGVVQAILYFGGSGKIERSRCGLPLRSCRCKKLLNWFRGSGAQAPWKLTSAHV